MRFSVPKYSRRQIRPLYTKAQNTPQKLEKTAHLLHRAFMKAQNTPQNSGKTPHLRIICRRTHSCIVSRTGALIRLFFGKRHFGRVLRRVLRFHEHSANIGNIGRRAPTWEVKLCRCKGRHVESNSPSHIDCCPRCLYSLRHRVPTPGVERRGWQDSCFLTSAVVSQSNTLCLCRWRD